MGLTVTILFSIGLCLNWGIGAQMDSLPRPTLWADPGPVVHKGANVTLRCWGLLGRHRFQLWKDGGHREERNESEHLAEFVIRNVDVERDARNYSCRYGQGNLWSEFSEPLLLVVMTEELIQPYISSSRMSSVNPRETVTLCCQVSPMDYSQEYTFALLEAKSLEPLQLESPRNDIVTFSLLSLRAEDSGSYSCVYYNKRAPFRGSLPSQSLLLTVKGLLPKPTLRPHPGLIVVPGTNVTLWCSRPKMFSLKEVEFTLSKSQQGELVNPKTSKEPWTGFLLSSVTPEDTGNYTCAYRNKKYPYRQSESSDALELLVTGSLPRPSLSALPGLVVKPGTHVTLQCWQPPRTSLWRAKFILFKVGTPQPLQTQRPAGTTADFTLISVRSEDAGNYSCVYHGMKHSHQVSEPSDMLEIRVTVSEPKNKDVNICPSTHFNYTLLLILIFVSLFLLLCVLLLIFLCLRSIHLRSPQKANTRRCLCCSCLPWCISMAPDPDIPKEEALYTEIYKESPRQASVSMAEDSQGVTYAQLNIKSLNKKNREPMEPCTEPKLSTE